VFVFGHCGEYPSEQKNGGNFIGGYYGLGIKEFQDCLLIHVEQQQEFKNTDGIWPWWVVM
jgi:Zn-finger protein